MTLNLVKTLAQAEADSYTAEDARIDELRAEDARIYELTQAEVRRLTPEFTVTYDEYKALNKEERDVVYNKISLVLRNNGYVGNINMWDVAYESYNNMTAVEDAEYYAENIEAFRAYQAKMGEPDFDWGFYSDWHKDMFGFRPR